MLKVFSQGVSITKTCPKGIVHQLSRKDNLSLYLSLFTTDYNLHGRSRSESSSSFPLFITDKLAISHHYVRYPSLNASLWATLVQKIGTPLACPFITDY